MSGLETKKVKVQVEKKAKFINLAKTCPNDNIKHKEKCKGRKISVLQHVYLSFFKSENFVSVFCTVFILVKMKKEKEFDSSYV